MNALVAVLLFLVPTADTKDKEKELSAEAKKEVKKIEGKWKAVKAMVDGKEEAPEGGEELIVEFVGNKMIVNQGPAERGKVELEIAALDPTTTPKCIDFKSLSERPGLQKGTVIEGIYKLDGDTLVIALNPLGGSDRPDKFESPKDSKFIVITFERVKK